MELGDQIRLIDAWTIADIEGSGPVPELVILGDSVMYELLYDDAGDAAGVYRFDDPRLIE